MTDVLKAIFNLVIWTFVPVMLSIALLKAYGLPQRIEHARYKGAAQSGFIGGFILFVIILIYQVGQFIKNGFPEQPIYQGLNIALVLGAAAVTFGIFYGGRVMPPKLIGWIVLAFTFSSFWALWHYLFVHTANEYIYSPG